MEMIIPQNRILDEMKLNDYLKDNTLYLDCEIERTSQVKFCRELRKLAEQELKKPKNERKSIKVRISSFGGWVVSVFAMISTMEFYEEKGIIIETYCDGYCASGGSKVLMAGSKGYRYITRYGTVLVHQSNSFKYGHSTLQEDIKDVEESLKDWEMLKVIFKKHSKLSDEDINNFTEKNINFTYRPQECLEKGIVDKIL